MPRQVSRVSDMEIDEISLVDRPANAHAQVRIAKRASQEDAVPPDEIEEIEAIFDANGTPVDPEELEFGDVVYDKAGQGYEFLPDGAEDDEDAAEGEHADELELVGKARWGAAKAAFEGPRRARAARLFGDTGPVRRRRMAAAGAVGAAGGGGYAAGRVRKSLADEVREELAKAVTDTDRDEVMAKALDALSKADERAAEAEYVAKSERDLRLEREYIGKAAEYNVPIAAEELGPVLMHCAEALSYEDCAVLHKALCAAGEMLYTEAGFTGEADNLDPMAQIEAHLAQAATGVSKRDGEPVTVSKAQAVTEFFAQNPAAYDDYVASRNQ